MELLPYISGFSNSLPVFYCPVLFTFHLPISIFRGFHKIGSSISLRMALCKLWKMRINTLSPPVIL